MKYIGDVDNDRFSLEVYACECGFHIGIDATYIDQVDKVIMKCPGCQSELDTSTAFKEELEELT